MMGRKKAIFFVGGLIFIGNILCSLGWGPLANVTLPWPSFTGVAFYNFHDWFDCFSGYDLLPLGCLLTCLFIVKGWGWEGYTKEIHKHDPQIAKPLSKFDKTLITVVIPVFMVIVLLNVFGVLQ